MDEAQHRHAARLRLAAASWLAAAVLYLGAESWAATAFSPPYSYARNYISDLGATTCGTAFDARAICSPLHALMNANFILQGVLFAAAAAALAGELPRATRTLFLAFAAANGIGNGLVGLVPEDAGALNGGWNWHVLGAFLAIAFGNGTALLSAWSFRTLRLARIHRWASLVLPLVAGMAVVLLLTGDGSPISDGIWERISVYAITAWEILSAACLLRNARAR